MATTHEELATTLSELHYHTPNHRTPSEQRAQSVSSLNCDDTPVDKSALSLPLSVKPGTGNGHINKELAFSNANLYHEFEIESLHLHSPIFAQGPQYPGLEGRDFPESKDIMEGIEHTPTSSSEPTNGEITDSLVNMENRSQIHVEGLEVEWLGTSELFIDCSIGLQKDGNLGGIIDYRKALVHDIAIAPYDPTLLIDLSSVDSQLGFTDIGTANAHRALVLIEAAMDINAHVTFPTNLGTLVRSTIGRRLGTNSTLIINDEIDSLYLQTYRALVTGLLGCTSFWEGLKAVKTGLKRFSQDPELLEMQDALKAHYLHKLKCLQEVFDAKDNRVAASNNAKIYQKKYPWMDQKLYIRTPGLVRHVNSELAKTGKCVVKSVVFGPPSRPPSDSPQKAVKEDEDVGPLGLFAAQDIKADERFMVDTCVTCVADVSTASRLEYCEACHAILRPPFLHASQLIEPSCCATLFCSMACHDEAVAGYHRVICRKNFDWLFENMEPDSDNKHAAGRQWTPILFLRIVAVVLADIRTQKGKKKAVHPLQHPLIARMSANYPPENQVKPEIAHDWQYFENIVAPTRIMMQLGINIFTDSTWTPEVIQTIFWRMDNNVNTSRITLPNQPTVNMVNISPNYLFINHSCEPNVAWHGTVPNADVDIRNLMGMNGEILNPGCSAVYCIAARDIKKGEELKISYIGDPLGQGEDGDATDQAESRSEKRDYLKKWFERGCGCQTCNQENLQMDRLKKEIKKQQNADWKDKKAVMEGSIEGADMVCT